MPSIEELIKKRDQLTARIKTAENRKSQEDRKAEARIKILVGSAILERYKKKGETDGLVKIMEAFLTRPIDRKAVLGENGDGSEIFFSLTSAKESEAKNEQATPFETASPGPSSQEIND